MCKFNCNKNCPHCEWYEPGGYYYESDCEGYRDEGCDVGENPETCTKYSPTYIQSLLDEIDELNAKVEALTKVDEKKLINSAYDYYRSKKPAYEFVNYHIGMDEITDAYKAGYRKAKEE